MQTQPDRHAVGRGDRREGREHNLNEGNGSHLYRLSYYNVAVLSGASQLERGVVFFFAI